MNSALQFITIVMLLIQTLALVCIGAYSVTFWNNPEEFKFALLAGLTFASQAYISSYLLLKKPRYVNFLSVLAACYSAVIIADCAHNIQTILCATIPFYCQ